MSRDVKVKGILNDVSFCLFTLLFFVFFLVPSVWSQWGQWSECSVTCGGGERTMKRECLEEGQNGGRQCSEDISEEIGRCGEDDCPMGKYLLYIKIFIHYKGL